MSPFFFSTSVHLRITQKSWEDMPWPILPTWSLTLSRPSPWPSPGSCRETTCSHHIQTTTHQVPRLVTRFARTFSLRAASRFSFFSVCGACMYVLFFRVVVFLLSWRVKIGLKDSNCFLFISSNVSFTLHWSCGRTRIHWSIGTTFLQIWLGAPWAQDPTLHPWCTFQGLDRIVESTLCSITKRMTSSFN